MEKTKKTLVIGASPNPERYSWKAVTSLRRQGHEVVAFGNKSGAIGDIEIQTALPHPTDIHTITLYLNPERQKDLYPYILQIHPERLIFNPGTENKELKEIASQQGIETVEGCTLVMLSIGNY